MTDVPLRFGLERWAAGAAAGAAGRVAYVGNAASVGAQDSRPGLRLLTDAGVEVRAVWAPEHGFGVDAAEGEQLADGALASGVPVHSLYGTRHAPDAAMLDAVDTIVFDLQDVGARYYTYWHVLKRCLEAAEQSRTRMVVCDRPNPLGDAQWGNVLDCETDALVGCWAMAMQHGLTTGDVAAHWSAAHPGAPVEIVPGEGWDRQQDWGLLGLEWTAPSLNLRSLDAVRAYPGTCLGEGLNLSVGRGTPRAFEWLAAPWLDAERAAQSVNDAECGWRADTEAHTPTHEPYSGVRCAGVRFVQTQAGSDPILPVLTVIAAALGAHPNDCRFHDAHFDALAGGSALREGLRADADVSTLMGDWAAQRAAAPLRPAATLP